jgi:hypothetical protein
MQQRPVTPAVVTAADTQRSDMQRPDMQRAGMPGADMLVVAPDTEVAITGAVDRSTTLATATMATGAQVSAFPLSAV